MSESLHGSWFVALTIVLAMLLSIYPMPEIFRWARPDWLMLVMMFWLIMLPRQFGLLVAFFIGLLADIVHPVPLGTNALAFVVVAYLAQISYQRVRMYNSVQQALILFVLVAFHQLVIQWATNFAGSADNALRILWPAPVTALLWFPIKPLLAAAQRVLSLGP